MQLKPYKDAILQTKEEEAKQMAPAHAEETKALLSVKISQLKISRQKQETAIATAAGRYPLDVDALSAALDQAELTERSIEQLENIQKQLFPA